MGCQLGQRNDGEWVDLRTPDQFVLVPVRQRLDAKPQAHTEAVVLAAVDAGVGRTSAAQSTSGSVGFGGQDASEAKKLWMSSGLVSSRTRITLSPYSLPNISARSAPNTAMPEAAPGEAGWPEATAVTLALGSRRGNSICSWTSWLRQSHHGTKISP